MKSVFFIAIGVGIGFALARSITRTSDGSNLISGIDARAKAFTGAIAEGYRAREAELRRRATA